MIIARLHYNYISVLWTSRQMQSANELPHALLLPSFSHTRNFSPYNSHNSGSSFPPSRLPSLYFCPFSPSSFNSSSPTSSSSTLWLQLGSETSGRTRCVRMGTSQGPCLRPTTRKNVNICQTEFQLEIPLFERSKTVPTLCSFSHTQYKVLRTETRQCSKGCHGSFCVLGIFLKKQL